MPIRGLRCEKSWHKKQEGHLKGINAHQHHPHPIRQKMEPDLAQGKNRFPEPLQGDLCADSVPSGPIISLADAEMLDHLHTTLDHAVLDAYAWPHNLSDEQILEKLLALNLQRAREEKK